ncbi:MAG: ATP-dependent Clp protease adapter ClpS [Alphaproteobacteria bacterium]|nr:ATP-dependent Clp protease adapter ClpS [Alphaproteobacteria bacterium]
MGVAHKYDNLAVLEPQVETRKPQLYKVVMMNDDYTPMELVIEIIKTVFNKTTEEANRLTMEVHNRGAAVCGVYTRDVAETKSDLAIDIARREEHPLQCLIEKE